MEARREMEGIKSGQLNNRFHHTLLSRGPVVSGPHLPGPHQSPHSCPHTSHSKFGESRTAYLLSPHRGMVAENALGLPGPLTIATEQTAERVTISR